MKKMSKWDEKKNEIESLAISKLEELDTSLEFKKQQGALSIRFPHQLMGKKYQEWLTSFTEQEKEEVRENLSVVRAGNYSNLPIICPGEHTCPHRHICPFIPINKIPISQQCLTGDTKIAMANGSYKLIKDIEVGDIVLSLNTTSNKIESKKVLASFCSGEKEVYKIKTRFGHSIKCTDNHPFYTLLEKPHARLTGKYVYKTKPVQSCTRGYRSILEGLNNNSWVALLNNYQLSNESIKDNENLAVFLGFHLTDGHCSKYQLDFVNTNKLYIDLYYETIKKLGSKQPHIYYRERKNKKPSWTVYCQSNRKQDTCKEIIKSYGLWNKRGIDKTIPDDIFTWKKEDQIKFINILWAGDGCIVNTHIGNIVISITQENLSFFEKLQFLLWKYGIQSTIGFNNPRKTAYNLQITDNLSKLKFLQIIGPILGKEPQCEIALKKLESTIENRASTVDGDIRWSLITSIKKQEDIEDVFDITVEDNSNFFANGILVHNCPLEQEIIVTRMQGLMQEYQIDGTKPTEFMLLSRLVEIDLIEFRCNSILSSPAYQSMFRTVIRGSTPQGEIIHDEELNPLYMLKEKLGREKMHLINLLVGSPQEKYKKQAALKEVKSNDYSTKIADMNKTLVSIERHLSETKRISAEVSSKQQLPSSVTIPTNK